MSIQIIVVAKLSKNNVYHVNPNSTIYKIVVRGVLIT